MKKRIQAIVLAMVIATSCLFSNGAVLTASAAEIVESGVSDNSASDNDTTLDDESTSDNETPDTPATPDVPVTEECCITVDGELSDWDFIEKLYSDGSVMVQAAAFIYEDSLYFMREYADISTYGGEQIFFDTDGDHTNGYLNAGIDWMLQGANLYAYSGKAGAWGWSSTGTYQDGLYTREFQNNDATVEYIMPLSSLNNPDEILINIGAYDVNWANMASYPASQNSLVVVPKYADVKIESDSLPLSNITFTPSVEKLQAITPETMMGGVIGTLSAEGGDGENYKYSFAVSKNYGIDNDRFTIEGNKIIVKDSTLAPGSYSIFVNVKSDIRSAKQALSFIIDSASATATITESVFAGQDGQWFAVAYNAANSIPTLSELKAATDGNKLYAYAKASSSLSNSAVFYIDTEATTGKAMDDVWSDAASVEYKVDMAGNLYAYTDGAWAEAGTVEINKTSMAVEIGVDLSALGNATGTLKVAIEEQGNSLLPNVGTAMYAVTTPIIGTMPSITQDGDPSDWDGIAPLASGTGTVGDIYAVHDNDNLYVMTTLSEVDDLSVSYALSTNLLINGDGDSSTGFQHSAYPSGSGADFLVQDWFSIDAGKDAKNVEFFYTTSTTGGWVNKGSGTSYKIYAPLEEAGTYCVEFAVPLSEMRKSTSTVSDDIYVAVHRSEDIVGLQAGTKGGAAPTGGSFVFVPKYNTTVPVAVDDTFADWNDIARAATNTSTDTTCNLVATKSAERLYTLVTNDLGGLNTVNTYYISTSDETGYNVSGYEKVDYIVKDAKLYAVDADNTIGEELGDVWMSYYNDNIEMQLYLSQIGNPETIKIAWRGIDGSYAIPADNFEYLNVTAEFELQREAGYYYPVEDFASFTNPYKGWVAWAGDYSSKTSPTYAEFSKGNFYFDFNTVYLGVRWSELQPNSDQDWELDAILDKYNVSEWLASGKRINFRFLMDNPEELGSGKLEDRMDIPKWLYEELVQAGLDKGLTEEEAKKEAGTFYHDADGSMGLGYDVAGFSPNYYNEKLIERHDEIIRKLAEYFDNNQVTAFVQVGSIGHWGEFHTWPDGTGEWPNPSTCAKYMEPYTKYFHNVKLGVRKPYPYAAENNYGLFNDIFGVTQYAGTPAFYGYIMNGDTDMNGGATGEEVEASKMPDFWKTNYSGGEFAEGQVRAHVTNETKKDGTAGIIGCMDQVRYTHVSWLGPCSAADFKVDEIGSYVYEANVLALQKLMGYNFALEKITKLDTVAAGSSVAIDMIWNNQGVAPFYYEWPIEFSLINADGKVVATQLVDGGITNWLPGRTSVEANLTIPANVAAGTYTLAVAIADKDTLEPAMKLAIAGRRDDLRHPLYSVTVEAANRVVFDSNGGSEVAAQYVADGALAVAPEAPTKTGFIFAGWTLNGVEYDFATPVTGSMVLVAQWTVDPDYVDFGDVEEGDIPADVSGNDAAVESQIPTGLWIAGVTTVSAGDVAVDKLDAEYTYTGTAIKPEIRVFHGKTLLKEKVDYTITYKNNKNAATFDAVNKNGKSVAPTITVKGKGNYAGTQTVTFTIAQADLNEVAVVNDVIVNKKSSAQKPVPVVTVNGKKLKAKTDFTVSYTDVSGNDLTATGCKDAGDYKIVVTGNKNYTGTVVTDLTITDKALMSKVSVSKIKAQTYTGSVIEPAVTVKYKGKVVDNANFDINYLNNVEIGTASVVITAKADSDFIGEKVVTFKINGDPIKKAKITLATSVEYTGSEIRPTVSAVFNGKVLYENRDFLVEYQNNVAAGKATVVITGIKSFTGTVKKTFKITGYDLTKDNANLVEVVTPDTVAYAKGGAKVSPIVMFGDTVLTEGKDYTLSYKNNKKVIAEDATKNGKSIAPVVTIKGKGNFAKTTTDTFGIVAQNINAVSATAADKVVNANVDKCKSVPVLVDIDGKKLKANTDYKVVGYSVSGNDMTTAPEVGTNVTVTIEGVGNYEGTRSDVVYKIVAKDIAKEKVTIANQTYTGKAIELTKSDFVFKNTAVTADDFEIVSYSNNVKKGTAKVTIKGVGNTYGGTKTVTFKIVAKGFVFEDFIRNLFN